MIFTRLSFTVVTLSVLAGSTLAQDAVTQTAPAQPPSAAPEPIVLPAPDLSQSANPTLSTPAEPFESRVHRMGLWLAALDREGLGSRMNNISWSFADASLFGLATVAFATSETDSRSSRAGRNIFCALSGGVSAGFLYAAIADITLISSSEERNRRWRALNHRVDEATLARFEGELATEASIARRRRFLSAGGDVAVAAMGGALLVLTPLSDLAPGARTGFYVATGVLFAWSTWSLLTTLLRESRPEQAYRDYKAGFMPDVDLEPSGALELSFGGTSLAVHGRF